MQTHPHRIFQQCLLGLVWLTMKGLGCGDVPSTYLFCGNVLERKLITFFLPSAAIANVFNSPSIMFSELEINKIIALIYLFDD